MKFRAEHYAYCCQHRTLPRKELTERFNAHFGTDHSVSTINTYCKRNGILTGRKGRYGPGHTPKDGSAPPLHVRYRAEEKARPAAAVPEKPAEAFHVENKDDIANLPDSGAS